MKKIRISIFVLLTAALAFELAAAAPQKPPQAPTSKPVPKIPSVPVERVLESSAKYIILPSTTDGIVVFRECEGCPARSLRASSSTVYRFNQQVLTLGELRSALTRYPATNVGVVVSGKTRELISLNAVNEQVSLRAPGVTGTKTK